MKTQSGTFCKSVTSWGQGPGFHLLKGFTEDKWVPKKKRGGGIWTPAYLSVPLKAIMLPKTKEVLKIAQHKLLVHSVFCSVFKPWTYTISPSLGRPKVKGPVTLLGSKNQRRNRISGQRSRKKVAWPERLQTLEPPERCRGLQKSGADKEEKVGFWLEEKQNFKGNRAWSFKDPLQDPSTPTIVYLSCHLRTATLP